MAKSARKRSRARRILKAAPKGRQALTREERIRDPMTNSELEDALQAAVVHEVMQRSILASV